MAKSNIDKDRIERMCNMLHPSQSVQIERHTFELAYRYGYPSPYNSCEEAFLGSNMGSWTVTHDELNGCYIIQLN